MNANPAPPPGDQAQSWTSGVKDVVTSSLSSQVWATVGQGIVNEVFWPEVDQPQVKDFGFLIRTGAGSTAEWVELKAEASYTVSPYQDLAVPLATITHTGAFYELRFQLIPDPDRDALLVDYELTRPAGVAAQPVQLYPLLAPHLDSYTANSGADTGMNNFAWVQDGALFARDDQPNQHVLCLDASPAFDRVSVGYVGFSDGWTDLHSNNAMTWQYTSAGPGVVALTGELPAPQGELSGMLSLGFGSTPAAAETAAQDALAATAGTAREKLIGQWEQQSAPLKLPGVADGLTEPVADAVKQSATVLGVCRARHGGAIVAGLATPWGSQTNDPGGYHMTWCRDGSETALALAALGDFNTGRELLSFLAKYQRNEQNHSNPADYGSWGRCYFSDGSSLPGLQLDETAFPVLLAAKLAELGATLPDGTADIVHQAVTYLVKNGPVDSPDAVDRWEETPGGSPFTLGLIVVALVAAAQTMSEPEQAYLLPLADNWNERIEEFTYVAGSAIDRAYGTAGHYVRIGPAATLVRLGNQIDQNTVINAELMVGLEFLYLARLGLREPSDRRITDTVTVVDNMLRHSTATGYTYVRYDLDGYGEWLDGSGWPVRHFGIGRPWPLLAGERGHYDALAGANAAAQLDTMLAMRGRGGLLPEQVWDAGDLPWQHLTNGHPTGSAMPLAWAHSELIKLAVTIATGSNRPVELLDSVKKRYTGQQPPQSNTWHWRSAIPIGELPSGCTLLVEDTQQFTMHFGFDNWQPNTITDQDATPLPFGMYGIILDAQQLADHTSLQFTRRFASGWENQNHAVLLNTPRPAARVLRPRHP
jgi:glucoamylase